ncbi:tRNA (adenosine(37)-N6)-threonylcarbamoyltransferase complex dimerization subunit type 1 TsaB [Loktanella sp. SALINAS62]|nr:tRNA (adenosine(37)-N6)-threonylcarbamoyltransferase complex dimerization subunit type 1 TsaB [Loktanella sp. SALINAS62]
MTTPPVVLAFDTSLPHCAAALWRKVVLDHVSKDMTRGQAEHLMPMLQDLLATNGLVWSDLNLIAVGIGPGNFTGIRVSVAAARGLGLALQIPVMGVSLFDILRQEPHGAELVTLDAPRGQVHGQLFRDGIATGAPCLFDPAAPPSDLHLSGLVVTGASAHQIADHFGATARVAAPVNVAARIASCAAIRWAQGDRTPPRPAPLYVRPADAAPPRDAPPTIIA